MTMLRFLQNLFRPHKGRRRSAAAAGTSLRRFRPRLEVLEDRRLLSAIWMVTSTSDDEQMAGTLPNAVMAAHSGDTIQFDTRSVFAKPITINLNHPLDIEKNLTITGPGQSLLTLTGPYGAIDVGKGAGATITDLTVSGCNGQYDPVQNEGVLTLRNCAVQDNTLAGHFGGIANEGQLTLEHCTVARNHVTGTQSRGGGIYNEGALTVRDSIITDNSAGRGGGIYNEGHTRLNVRPTIVNTAVSGNHASQDGGGIYDNGDLLVDDSCRVSDNTADRDGGGIYLPFRAFASDPDNSLTVCASTVSGNHATSGRGGGIYARNGALIHDSTISDNHARGDGGGVFIGFHGSVGVIGSIVENNDTLVGGGGGIFANTGTVTLSFCTIRHNIAFSYSGGGVFVGDTTASPSDLFAQGGERPLEISYCTLDDNYAAWQGGGLALVTAQGATVALDNSTLSRNVADNQGGGVYVFESSLHAVNSTIALNQAYAGGGVYNSHGTTSLESVTVASNVTSILGGGVFSDVPADVTWSGTTTLKNTIIAGNHTAPSFFGTMAESDVEGPIQSFFSNLIQSTSGATITAAPTAMGGPGLTISIGSHSFHDIYGVDPRLGRLQYSGGPTETMALLPGSPAIHAGDPTNAPRIDQRGLTRAGGSFDDTWMDIGAYATQTTGSPAVEPVIDCDGSSANMTPGNIPLTPYQPPIVPGPIVIHVSGAGGVGGFGSTGAVVTAGSPAGSPATVTLTMNAGASTVAPRLAPLKAAAAGQPMPRLAMLSAGTPSAISSFPPSSLLANYSLAGLGLQRDLQSEPLVATVSSHRLAHPVLTLGNLPEIAVSSVRWGTSAKGVSRQVQINMNVSTLSPQLLVAVEKQYHFAQATLTVPNPAVASGQTQFTLFDVRVTSFQISSTTCTITLDYGSLTITPAPKAAGSS
jgi:hypothetical protein